MIVNKDTVEPDLVHDIGIELEALFESDRTWEINANDYDLNLASTVQIIVRGSGHCYVSSISDAETYIWNLLNSYRESSDVDKFCTSTSYYDPLKQGIVFEYEDFISFVPSKI